ncbi:MAG: hypothetical protein WD274_05695 [Acidimicrobiia bacterium]
MVRSTDLGTLPIDTGRWDQIDMDTAFRHLRSFARNNRRHLTAVAVDVVSGAVALDEVRAGSSVSPSSLERNPARPGA